MQLLQQVSLYIKHYLFTMTISQVFKYLAIHYNGLAVI